MALIIPYRNRYEQLSIFVRQMHPFLKRQNVDYRIFVVEQVSLRSYPRNNCDLLRNVSFLNLKAGFHQRRSAGSDRSRKNQNVTICSDSVYDFVDDDPVKTSLSELEAETEESTNRKAWNRALLSRVLSVVNFRCTLCAL